MFSSWNTMVIEMSLLDFLAYKTGCQVGELPTVAKEDPIWISHSVMWMKPDTESLSGWNDALDYLAESCEEAQNQLLMALHRDQGRRAT